MLVMWMLLGYSMDMKIRIIKQLKEEPKWIWD